MPYNQFDGIADRQIVIPERYQYISNDVYIYYHLDLATIDDFSEFEWVRLYMKGHGYIGRFNIPSKAPAVIIHPNVPKNLVITYQLNIGCNGCTGSAMGEITVDTH